MIKPIILLIAAALAAAISFVASLVSSPNYIPIFAIIIASGVMALCCYAYSFRFGLVWVFMGSISMLVSVYSILDAILRVHFGIRLLDIF